MERLSQPRRRAMKAGTVCLALLLAPAARAQISGVLNPAGLQDARVVMYNPAAAAMLPGQAYLGLRLIYPGAIAGNSFALKTSQFAVSWPNLAGSGFSLGGHGRYLHAPLYYEGRFGLQVAYRLLEQLAVGVDASGLARGYDESDFDLVEANDPVFRRGSSRLVFDPAVGLFGTLWEGLSWGAALFHLNRPDLALQPPSYRLPREGLAGVAVTHRFARFDAGLQYRRERWHPAIGAEIFSPGLGRLRAGYGLENVVFEGQVRVLSRTALFYSFHTATNDLGLVSAGSHELGLIFALPWTPAAPPSAAPPDFLLQAMPPSRVVLPDETPLYHLSVVRRAGFTAPLKLEVTELPPHLQARLSTSEVHGTETVVLALESQGNLLPGDFPFIVLARSRDQVHHLPLHLRVNPTPRLVPEIFTTIDSVEIIEVRNVLEELPIIPRVFFPANQSMLASSRYDILSPQQSVFIPENVREINAAYRNLLNLVATRLKANPGAAIRLTGYSPGPRHEQNWRELAQARVQAVWDYLADSLAVAPSQILAAGARGPDRALGGDNPALQEEWQRVDLSAVPPFESQILAPLLVERVEVEAVPQRCGFVNKFSIVEAGVESWRITVLNAAGDTVEVITGRTALPDTVFWEWPHALVRQRQPVGTSGNGLRVRQEAGLAADHSGYYSLWLRDVLGQESTSSLRKIGIRHRRISQEIGVERIPIFLFGFGEHRLRRYAPELRRKLHAIAEKLESDPLATCLLKGHTDAIGDELNNQWLSVQRAKTVYELLVSFGIARERMSFIGHGEGESLGDNRLPEGRIMNRRVEVHIRHAPEWLNTGRAQK